MGLLRHLWHALGAALVLMLVSAAPTTAGTPLFLPPAETAVFGGSPAPVVGNFSQDAVVDVASATIVPGPPPEQTEVAVAVGHGDGTFEKQSPTTPVGAGIATSIAAADVNRDHRTDLVVYIRDSRVMAGDRVSVLLGDGTGHFRVSDEHTSDHSLGMPTGMNVAVDDFDGDGLLDILYAYNGLQLLHGNGDGTFADARNAGGSNLFAWVVSADMNGDAVMDAAVLSGETLAIEFGSGKGTFRDGPRLPVPRYGFDGVPLIAGDFDQDGRNDIAVIGTDRQLLVFIAGADAGFAGRAQYRVGDFSVSLETVDLDRDGRLDLLTANANSHDLSFLRGHGDGTFDRAQSLHAPFDLSALVTADFNRDRRLDVLAFGNGGSKLMFQAAPAPMKLSVSGLPRDNACTTKVPTFAITAVSRTPLKVFEAYLLDYEPWLREAAAVSGLSATRRLTFTDDTAGRPGEHSVVVYGRDVHGAVASRSLTYRICASVDKPRITDVRVRPATGGPQSTFTVAFRVNQPFGFYEIHVGPRCAGRAKQYPWQQTLILIGPPIWLVPNAVQLPRPVGGGWCAGRYTGWIGQHFFTGPTTGYTSRLARFKFTVRRGVSTPLPERPCRPRKSTTVFENATMRIYRTKYADSVWTMGCLFSVRGHMQLPRFGFASRHEVDVDSIDKLWPASPFVAFKLTSAGPADYQTELASSDLRTGERVGWTILDGGGPGALVVSPRTGAFAYTETFESSVSVNRITGQWTGQRLDSGAIDPKSLRLHGRRLTWTKDGVEQSSTLD